MTISATMICDSMSNQGHRMSTLLLRYPRMIHAELLTHKKLSRSSSSSRAIPTKRMIEDMRRDPAMPVYWGSNKAGMQAGAELAGLELQMCKSMWLDAMEDAITVAQSMQELGLHKQIANRVLEPFSHINVLVTATDWNNTFALRRHDAAQPEIHELFDRVFEAIEESDPALLYPGEWHLPFINLETSVSAYKHLKDGRITRDEPKPYELNELLLKVSTARCARTSYRTHEGKISTIAEDLDLFKKLIETRPVHASPSEHQGTPDTMIPSEKFPDSWDWENPEKHGNLTGWIQHRKLITDEYVAG